jgi:rhodanese-related sulfurtransferase
MIGTLGRRPQEACVDIPEIDVDELETHWSQGAFVLDVREPDEYEDGHVPGAVPMPLATVPDHVDQVPTTGPVYVICAAGARSRRAAEFLRGAGADAINVAGGTRAWIDAEKQTVTGPEPR